MGMYQDTHNLTMQTGVCIPHTCYTLEPQPCMLLHSSSSLQFTTCCMLLALAQLCSMHAVQQVSEQEISPHAIKTMHCVAIVHLLAFVLCQKRAMAAASAASSDQMADSEAAGLGSCAWD